MGACTGTYKHSTQEMEKANPETNKYDFSSPAKKINMTKP